MTRRTYWHLESLGRKPTDYEIVSSRLLYYPGRGLEVRVPAGDWIRRHQAGSPLTRADWERFEDPRATTYASYVTLRNEREIYVDGLLRAAEESGADRALSPGWVGTLDRLMAPLRYPIHGLQMAGAYVAHLAPEGRVVLAGLFQAADEMRRVHRLAYRLRQIQDAHPGTGEGSRALWQDDPMWQPLRELVERLLATYDWGEAFAALNLAVKPVFDALFLRGFARLARRNGDEALAGMLGSFGEDAAWHREWSGALARLAVEDRPDLARTLKAWTDAWRPAALRAAAAFRPAFEGAPSPEPFDAILEEAAR
jgi:toluene monooxygenase system protein E